MLSAHRELFGTSGPYTGNPLYRPPIQMNIEPGCRFLETEIRILWGYHLVCFHHNPDSDLILSSLSVPNYRVVPYDMHTSSDAKLEYVLGMFHRVESNSMFSAHMAMAILEMVVELQLHRWPLSIVTRAIKRRDAIRSDGVYEIVTALIRDSFE